MSVLWWILFGFLGYWMALIFIQRQGFLPASINTSGPIMTIHTTRGRAFLEWAAGPRRFWRAWGNIGVGIALVIMFGMFLAVVNAAIAALIAPEPTQVTEPRNVLVIPGVNDFLPLSATPEIVIGLLIGLVVHEGGHGLLCRVEDINIESMGVAMLAVIPIGAFVQPEETSQDRADRGAKSRMFAAGVMNNFAVTIIAFLLLFALIGALIVPAAGAAVGGTLGGSAASEAGIETGDRIVGINDDEIDRSSELEQYLEESGERELSVTLASGETVTVERSVQVVGTVEGGPVGLAAGDRILAVNEEPVYTESAVREIAEDEPVITASTGDEQATFPAGAYVSVVTDDGPFAAAGAPTDETVTPVITAIDGERVVTMEALQSALQETEPGQEVTITAYLVEDGESISSDDEPTEFTVELDEHPDGQGLLGVAMHPGMTGMTLDDFGVQPYPTETFLATLGGDTESSSLFGLDTFFGMVFTAMLLPIASIMSGEIDQNFAGITGSVTNFYEVNGPLAGAEPLVFLLVNILFWAGWINFNLGIFNCIPAFPLDGGHLLRSSTESIVSRLPIANRYIAVKYVTVSVGLLMLLGLLLMVFGQGLLG